jgi:hypothetical protein
MSVRGKRTERATYEHGYGSLLVLPMLPEEFIMGMPAAMAALTAFLKAVVARVALKVDVLKLITEPCYPEG